jgi:monovalent cation:H+ antiporter-2, CPA2 family
MHSSDLLTILTLGFIAALILGYAMHRLGWSPIAGYLLAGIAVGPHTPGFVANRELAGQLAEIGVILLLFGVGLHFHPKDLLAVWRIAGVGAPILSVAATALGAAMCHAFGWSWTSGIVFGLTLSVTSTVVLTRMLSERGELQSPVGRLAVGWLVMEDVFTVFVLVLMPAVLGGSSAANGHGLATAVALVVLKLAAFFALTLAAGGLAVPWLLGKMAETRSRELFALSVLAVALGIAVGAAWAFQVSMALGAFLAGVVVGQTEFSARAGSDVLPLRDAFAVMFFLSVGLLFDPGQALVSAPLILGTLAIVVVGKPLGALALTSALGCGSRVAIGVSLSLTQVGEFSFLLAALGRTLGVLPAEATNVIVAVSIASIMLNPALARAAGPLAAFVERHRVLWRLLNRRSARDRDLPANPDEHPSPAHRAVIVGYGPIGQTLATILRRRGIEPTVIEMNIDTHRSLRAQGQRAVYGDANRPEVLEEAGIVRAASLILSASGSVSAVEAIRIAREQNPGIHVVARADFLRQTAAMREAGASEVFSGEGEVALAMAASVLCRLGATPDQLDEAREQVRETLLEEQNR